MRVVQTSQPIDFSGLLITSTKGYYIPEWDKYDDWVFYRSSYDNIKKSLSLLNEMYYIWEERHISLVKEVTETEIKTILWFIENIGGILGLRPTMEPYVTEEMRNVYLSHWSNKYYKDEISSSYPRLHKVPTNLIDAGDIRLFRINAAEVGLTQQEIDKAIQWRTKPLTDIEKNCLIEIIKANASPELDFPSWSISEQYARSFRTEPARAL